MENKFPSTAYNMYKLLLEKASQVDAETREAHIEYARSMKEQSSKSAVVTCPDCGHIMVKRRSRAGKYFWGCSMYPVCRGYRPLNS